MFTNHCTNLSGCGAQRGCGFPGGGTVSCVSPCCQGGSVAVGPQGPIGPQGPAGPAAATIPFSINQSGAQFSHDELGNPQVVHFSGFGTADYGYVYLNPGEWPAGIISLQNKPFYGSAFVMPYSAALKNIFVLFATQYTTMFETGSRVYPFACLAVSNTDDLTFTILQDTIVNVEPYLGGIEYPKHTLRRGSLTGLDVSIPEGTLVAIVVGIRGENVTEEQYASLTVSGGIYLQ